MDATSALWRHLEPELGSAFNCCLETPILDLYSLVYRYSSTSDVNAQHFLSSFQTFLESTCNARLLTLNTMQADLDIVSCYSTIWKNYDIGAQIVAFIFRYFTLNFFNAHTKSVDCRFPDTFGSSGLDIKRLCYAFFRDIVFNRLKDRLVRAFLNCTRSASENGIPEPISMRSIVTSARSIGLSDKPFEIYDTNIEDPYINELRTYYQIRSATAWSNCSVSEYLRIAYAWLIDEENKAIRLLAPSSFDKVLKVCNETIIHSHLTELQAEATPLILAKRFDELRYLYMVVCRVDSGTKPLANALKTHVIQYGTTKMTEIGLTVLTDDTIEEEKERTRIGERDVPRQFVEVMLQVYNEMNIVVKVCNRDHYILTSLDQGMSALARVIGAPELLARYCDTILRRGSKDARSLSSDSEIEKRLDDIVLVFKWLADKDVFQATYLHLLARRLIWSISIGEEFERQMIQRLKTEQGYDFVYRMEKMITDCTLATTFHEGFATYLSDHGIVLAPMSTSILVLTSNIWPLHYPPSYGSIINPPQIVNYISHFDKYYGSVHKGRRLQFLFNECRSNLKMFSTCKRPIDITCTHVQMCILLLFNKRTSITLHDMITETGLDKDTLTCALRTILAVKLLTFTEPSIDLTSMSLEHRDGNGSGNGAGDDDRTDPSSASELSLNPSFESRSVKVDLTRTVSVEVIKADRKRRQEVDETRNIATRASIVRIMKARKKIKHNDLIQEVIKHLAGFQPRVPVIKHQIEDLIDKYYMCRCEDAPNEYVYMP